ncbi:MAG TPA: hypothetical protein VLJ10_04305, partial [Candidatus Bathyarchaeia archaeon]|nr:hypothetical protein [Candidatus Bathyarchaeia archaeon]
MRTIFSIAAVASLMLLLASPCLAQNDYDRYIIQADVDVEQKIISGHQTVEITNRGEVPIDTVYFHLYPNRYYSSKETSELFRYGGYFKIDAYPNGFTQGLFQISYVKCDGQELSFEIQGSDRTLLKVTLPNKIPPGQRFFLDMEFETALPHAFGRFGWHERIIKAAYWYPILAAQTSAGWDTNEFYPFHRPF